MSLSRLKPQAESAVKSKFNEEFQHYLKKQCLKTKCGSPSYAAPEILKGFPYDGFKTDIWCCGIILYAMVCGYLPFDGDTNKILFKNILKCEPEVPDYLNDFTQDLIVRILTSDPDMRITIDESKKHRFFITRHNLP